MSLVEVLNTPCQSCIVTKAIFRSNTNDKYFPEPNMVLPISNANDEFYLVMNDLAIFIQCYVGIRMI